MCLKEYIKKYFGRNEVWNEKYFKIKNVLLIFYHSVTEDKMLLNFELNTFSVYFIMSEILDYIFYKETL